MQIVYEIKSDLTSENISLANTLRKSKILASKINLQIFKNWIHSELEEYCKEEEVPSYRKLQTNNYGTFINPLRRTFVK